MTTGARTDVELEVLRGLCNGGALISERLNFCGALAAYRFGDAEHHVVFESVRLLLGRGQLSAEQLSVHLINRGFPETEMSDYFVHNAPSVEETRDRIADLQSSKG